MAKQDSAEAGSSRRFEYRRGNSQKFWTIAVDGASYTVSYGRIGANGKTRTKAFKDEAKAKAVSDKLIAAKLGKGYYEVTVKQVGVSRLSTAFVRKRIWRHERRQSRPANKQDASPAGVGR